MVKKDEILSAVLFLELFNFNSVFERRLGREKGSENISDGFMSGLEPSGIFFSFFQVFGGFRFFGLLLYSFHGDYLRF